MTIANAGDQHADADSRRGLSERSERCPRLIPGISVVRTENRIGNEVIAD